MKIKMEKSSPRVLIIGAGGMGKWIARHLWSAYQVWITDSDKSIVNKISEPLNRRFTDNPAYDSYELVVNAVSLSSAAGVIRKLKEKNYAGTVVDMSSLKQSVNKEMLSLAGNAVSVHPLFGPGARKLEGKTVLLVPVKDRENEVKMANLIFGGAKIIEVDASTHDVLVAHTIQLTQVLSIVASRLMVHDSDLMGTSSRIMRYVEAASLYNSSQLVGEMLKANSFSSELFTEMKEVINELEHGNVNFKEPDNVKELYDRIYSAMESGCI